MMTSYSTHVKIKNILYRALLNLQIFPVGRRGNIPRISGIKKNIEIANSLKRGI